MTDSISDGSQKPWSNPRVVWLQPWCQECETMRQYSDGRLWCENSNPWPPCEECGKRAVKYTITARDADGKVGP